MSMSKSLYYIPNHQYIFSLKDCVKECISCDTCVGFAQKKNQCYLCRTDISVGHLVNFGLLKQFYISQDYLEQGNSFCFYQGAAIDSFNETDMN